MNKRLLEQLENNSIEHIAHCSCGAYTVYINNTGYSVHEDNFNKHFPDIDKKLLEKELKSDNIQKYCNCNYCVNHWGLDLCACGSGESFDSCEGGFGECGKPMQSIEDNYNHVRGGSSWI